MLEYLESKLDEKYQFQNTTSTTENTVQNTEHY